MAGYITISASPEVQRNSEMYYTETQKTPAELALAQELTAYQKNGCRICLNGRPCSPDKLAHILCMRENNNYMRDIISDESEKIREINFIRIWEEKENNGNQRARSSTGFVKTNGKSLRNQ